jgi:hypothetical protein
MYTYSKVYGVRFPFSVGTIVTILGVLKQRNTILWTYNCCPCGLQINYCYQHYAREIETERSAWGSECLKYPTSEDQNMGRALPNSATALISCAQKCLLQSSRWVLGTEEIPSSLVGLTFCKSLSFVSITNFDPTCGFSLADSTVCKS